MAVNLPRERLPAHLSYGVTRDGRIFFLDDRLQTTSWLHPLTGMPVQTGHQQVPGLPKGWEQAVTLEGAIYYIDHNTGRTTFDHPSSGHPGHDPSSPSGPSSLPSSPGSPTDKQYPLRRIFEQDQLSTDKIKINSPSKLRPLKAPPAKRDDNAMVTLKGWLYRQESGGWKSWKKRWCVLSNFGLFFYKDDKEVNTVGSILLPSYRIEPCSPSDTSKKFAFKAEHNNMKTYMFATDTQEDRTRWIEALKCAAVLKNPPVKEKETNNNNPLPKLIPKSPFMTWDDDDDEEEDQTPRGLTSWQNMLPQGGNLPPQQPMTQQSPKQIGPDVRGQGSPAGSYTKNDPNYPDMDHRQRVNPQGQMSHDPQSRYPGHQGRHQELPRTTEPQGRHPDDPHFNHPHSSHPNDPRNRDGRGRYNDGQMSHPKDHHYPDPRFDDPRNRHQEDREHVDPRNQHALPGGPHQQNPKYDDPRYRQTEDPRDPRFIDNNPYSHNQARPPGQENRINDPRSHYNTQSDKWGPSGQGQNEKDLYSYSTKHHRHPRNVQHNKDPSMGRKADSMPAQFVRRGEVPPRSDVDPYSGRKSDSLPGQYNRTNDISPNNRGDPYSVRKADSLQGHHVRGRDISPNISNYSDAAYDRHVDHPELQGRVPDPYPSQSNRNDPYGWHHRDEYRRPEEYSPGSRSQDRGPQQRFPDEEVMMRHQDVPQHVKHRSSMRDTPSERSSDNEGSRPADYEGFYSPTKESKQRELANRPLPAIKEPENPVLQSYHHREDTDDGYSTLTKYQEQRRKKAQEQEAPAVQQGSRSQQDMYNQDQMYQRQPPEIDAKTAEQQKELLHTYVNVVDRDSLRDLRYRDDGVEYIEEVPDRPPLPTAVRQQIVEEIAQAKTPRTSVELLEAEKNLETRMQQPSYFNYPTPVFPPKDHPVFDPENEMSNWHQGNGNIPRNHLNPDQYSRDSHNQRGYPEDRVDGGHSGERTVPKHIYGQERPRHHEADRRRREKPSGRPEVEGDEVRKRSSLMHETSPNDVPVVGSVVEPQDRSNHRPTEDDPVERAVEMCADKPSYSKIERKTNYKTSQQMGEQIESREEINKDHNKSVKEDLKGQIEEGKMSTYEYEKDEKEKRLEKEMSSIGIGKVMGNYANMNPLDMPYEEVHRLGESSEEDEETLAARRRERRSAFRPLVAKSKGANSIQRLDKLMATPPRPPSSEISEKCSELEDGTAKVQILESKHEDSKQNLFDEEETYIKKRISLASVASSMGSQHRGRDPRPGEGGRRHHPGKADPGLIHTVKEDPDMADEDVIETRGVPNLGRKYPLGGGRIRMSISAGDLIGKTHDELVLLLIQLRREHADLEKERNFFREKVAQRRASEHHYRRLLQESDGPFDQLTEREHYEYMQLRGQLDDAEKRLEVYRPMVNLVHNMVNMGSLYGGDNFMLASQYRKHLLSPDEFTPPKKMLEFSRKHQEEQIVHGIKEEIKQLSSDEVILEDKLERLYELDRRMHEQSYKVTQSQEDKDLLEKALQGILRKQDMSRDNPRELDQLIHQQRTIEKEISRVMHDLAKASRDLEETTAENNRIEHEVALLRSKVTGELSRSKSAPSLSDENIRNKLKMEKDLAQVKNMMAGLNQQGAQLSAAMNTLRRSSAGAKLATAFSKDDQKNVHKPASVSTYMETDLDSSKTTDLSQVQEILLSHKDQGLQLSPTVTVKSHNEPPITFTHNTEQENSLSHLQAGDSTADGPWDISDADENTKRFFGLIPKEKPKTLTVRDVKRQSEQRKEQLKVRKESEDDGGEPWSYNGADTEQSDGQNFVASSFKSSLHNQGPIYENLPPTDSALRKTWSSVSALGTPGSASNSRRSSALHLMMPRPFVPFGSQPTSIQTSYSSLNFDNQSKTSGSYRLAQSDDDSVVKATRVIIQPQLDSDIGNGPISPTSPPRGMFSVKRTPRGRYMTISSSQPVKLETSLIKPAIPNTSAGELMTNRSMDVPDIVQSSRTREEQMIDSATIDKEILYVPDKVLIPERYNPESDDEDLTEEDKQRRQEKAEKIKKLLAQQSVHSISQPDVSQIAGELHKKVEQEKVKRAQLLQVGQELARQVTLKTRQAAAERRKTWSGSPSKSHKEREASYNFMNGHDMYGQSHDDMYDQTRDNLFGQTHISPQEKLFI